jgi:hypothetical protein
MLYRGRGCRGWLTSGTLVGLVLGACGGPDEGPDEHTTGGTAGIVGTGGANGGVGTGTGGASQAPVRDLTCSSDTDCCAVVDGCYAQMWLVTQTQKAEIETYIASTVHPACFACIPPAVQVSCQIGQCVGTELPYASGLPTELMQTHCGPVPVSGAGGAGTAPSATGGATTTASRLTSLGDSAAGAATKFGCGPL